MSVKFGKYLPNPLNPELMPSSPEIKNESSSAQALKRETVS